MKTFWLFRSNLKHLEYYHEYETLEEFIKSCHDFYMLFPMWLLKKNYFDSVVVWRLSDKPKKNIDFIIEGKLYSQRWVKSFSNVFEYPKATMSFFRGGFQEYDTVTKQKPSHFGLKLYLATGKRIYPQWGGIYDVFLQEDPSDFREGYKCLPFYKTASPEIFFPYHDEKISKVELDDICWPCNFAQIRYKGQEEFIKSISKSNFLKTLKIIHCGNKSEVGKNLCRKYGVDNIEFLGHVDRRTLNHILNHCRLGLCLSNRLDGCPRIATEILMSGTPLILSDQTRILDYYKKNGVIIVNWNNIDKKIERALKEHADLKRQVEYAIKNLISFETVCKKNISRWLHFVDGML